MEAEESKEEDFSESHGSSDDQRAASAAYDWNSDDEPPCDQAGDIILLTNNETLMKKILEVGIEHEKPGRGDEILVKMIQVPVEYNHERNFPQYASQMKRYSVRIGYNASLPYACELAVRSMKKQELAELSCSHETAAILPNSRLLQTRRRNYAEMHKETLRLRAKLEVDRSAVVEHVDRDTLNSGPSQTTASAVEECVQNEASSLKERVNGESSSLNSIKAKKLKQKSASVEVKFLLQLLDFHPVNILAENGGITKKILKKGPNAVLKPNPNDMIRFQIAEVFLNEEEEGESAESLRTDSDGFEFTSKIVEYTRTLDEECLPYTGLFRVFLSMRQLEEARVFLLDEYMNVGNKFHLNKPEAKESPFFEENEGEKEEKDEGKGEISHKKPIFSASAELSPRLNEEGNSTAKKCLLFVKLLEIIPKRVISLKSPFLEGKHIGSIYFTQISCQSGPGKPNYPVDGSRVIVKVEVRTPSRSPASFRCFCESALPEEAGADCVSQPTQLGAYFMWTFGYLSVPLWLESVVKRMFYGQEVEVCVPGDKFFLGDSIELNHRIASEQRFDIFNSVLKASKMSDSIKKQLKRLLGASRSEGLWHFAGFEKEEEVLKFSRYLKALEMKGSKLQHLRLDNDGSGVCVLNYLQEGLFLELVNFTATAATKVLDKLKTEENEANLCANEQSDSQSFIAVIKLVDSLGGEKTHWAMSNDEKIKEINRLNKMGSTLMQRKWQAAALECYKKAFDIIRFSNVFLPFFEGSKAKPATASRQTGKIAISSPVEVDIKEDFQMKCNSGAEEGVSSHLQSIEGADSKIFPKFSSEASDLKLQGDSKVAVMMHTPPAGIEDKLMVAATGTGHEDETKSPPVSETAASEESQNLDFLEENLSEIEGCDDALEVLIALLLDKLNLSLEQEGVGWAINSHGRRESEENWEKEGNLHIVEDKASFFPKTIKEGVKNSEIDGFLGEILSDNAAEAGRKSFSNSAIPSDLIESANYVQNAGKLKTSFEDSSTLLEELSKAKSTEYQQKAAENTENFEISCEEKRELPASFTEENIILDNAVETRAAISFIRHFKDGCASFSSEEEVKGIFVRTILNLALCNLLQMKYAECISNCDQVIKVEPANEKAYYRKGKALYLMQDFSKALDTYREGLTLFTPGLLYRGAMKAAIKDKLEHQRHEAKCFGSIFTNPRLPGKSQSADSVVLSPLSRVCEKRL